MNTSKIIRIDPVPRQFSTTWMLGSRCNYDCMYCPAELHDKTSKHRDLDVLKQVWKQVLERTVDLALPYKIAFTGGEVTTNRAFLPLIQWIRSTTSDVQIFVTTNGSASFAYYKKLAALVNGISFSTHSEFINEAKFFSTAAKLNNLMVRPEKSMHVNIMDEYWNHERNKLYEEFCKKHNISYSVNHVGYDKSIRKEILRQGVYNIESI